MTYQAKMIAGGKMVIPAELRRSLGLKDGDTVVLEQAGDGTIVLKTYDQVVRDIRQSMRPYCADGGSVVDELIAERRAEAAREAEAAQRGLPKRKPKSKA